MKDLKARLSETELEKRKMEFMDFKKRLEMLESVGHAFHPSSLPHVRRLDDYY